MTSKQLLKNCILHFLYHSRILHTLKRLILHNRSFILMYHRIVESIENEFFFVQPGMYVSKRIFHNQIKYLSRNFQILSLDELLTKIANGNRIDHCCSITFDDGWKDNFDCAYPILKRYQIPATIFLATGYIDTNRLFWPEKLCYYLDMIAHKKLTTRIPFFDKIIKNENHFKTRGLFYDYAITKFKELSHGEKHKIFNQLTSIYTFDYNHRLMMTWDEIRNMHNSGLISFENHTVSHFLLDQLSFKDAKFEISESSKIICKKIGAMPSYFAFPNGNFNKELIDIVKSLGFKGAFTTKKGYLTHKTSFFEIPRIGIHEDVSYNIPSLYSRILFNFK